MDGRGFSPLVERIYDAAIEPDGWSRLAPALARAFDADSCILLGWDKRTGETLWAGATANFTPDILSDYVTHYRAMDLWLAGGLQVPVGTTAVGGELVDDAVLLRSEFYNDYLKRLSHFDMLGGRLGVARHAEGFVALHRPHNAARFDIPDKQSLTILMPHLTQAMRLYQRLFGAHRTGVIATAALDLMPTGVLAVGADRTLLYANAAAERLLSEGAGVNVHQRRLHCTDGAADRMLGQLVWETAGAATGRTSGAGEVLRASRTERQPLSLLVCPCKPGTLQLGFAQPVALVFVGDPEDREATPIEVLVRLYGLTCAEARLIRALLAGDSLQDYAERATLSLNTVKSQLKQVFVKTSTKRQAELMRQLLRNPVLELDAISSGRAPAPGKRTAFGEPR